MYKIYDALHTKLLDEPNLPFHLNMKVHKLEKGFKMFICSYFGYLKSIKVSMNLEERKNVDGVTYMTTEISV